MCFVPYLDNGWADFDKIWFRSSINLANVTKQNSAISVKNCGKSIFFVFDFLDYRSMTSSEVKTDMPIRFYVHVYI